MLKKKLTIILFSTFSFPFYSFSSCEQANRNNSLITKETLQLPKKHLYYHSKSISICVDNVLYETPNSSNFWLRFTIQNHTSKHSIAYFDLKDPHRHIYPNQWGIYTRNKLKDIDEIQITPLSIDSFKTPDKQDVLISQTTNKTHYFRNRWENITCDDKGSVNRQLVLSYPVSYRNLPSDCNKKLIFRNQSRAM